VSCPKHQVRQVQVEVPWARERSGFTLFSEALVMAPVKEMPAAAVAGLVGETDMRIWQGMIAAGGGRPLVVTTCGSAHISRLRPPPCGVAHRCSSGFSFS
jgi:hypothetical protein